MAPMPSHVKVGRHRYRVVNDVFEWNSLSSGTGVRHSDHGATHHPPTCGCTHEENTSHA